MISYHTYHSAICYCHSILCFEVYIYIFIYRELVHSLWPAIWDPIIQWSSLLLVCCYIEGSQWTSLPISPSNTRMTESQKYTTKSRIAGLQNTFSIKQKIANLLSAIITELRLPPMITEGSYFHTLSPELTLTDFFIFANVKGKKLFLSSILTFIFLITSGIERVLTFR